MNKISAASPRIILPSPLYAILDPSQTQGRPSIAILEQLLRGRARVIQIRAKEMAPKELLRLAREARRLIPGTSSLLIINDRVDIALAAEADGVHLGQEDLPLSVARRLMANKMIGVSTHDLAQALEAEKGGADYIGFGPIFGTATKETGYSPRGLNMLRKVRKAVKIPIVAIGGITEDNIAQVWDAGADAAAMIGDLMGARDVEEKVKRILLHPFSTP